MLSLWSQHNVNAPHIYEVLNNFTITFEFTPHLPWQNVSLSRRWAIGGYSVHTLQVESRFPMAHNGEKAKMTAFTTEGPTSTKSKKK